MGSGMEVQATVPHRMFLYLKHKRYCKQKCNHKCKCKYKDKYRYTH